jgi:hypothetical protein
MASTSINISRFIVLTSVWIWTHGFPDRQAPADHGRPVQPLHRLRHRARLPPRRRRTGVQLPGRALQGPHHRVGGRIRLRSWSSTAMSSDDAQIERLFADLGQHWDQFDGFVHAIAFAPREAIAGDFLDGLSRESFRIAHDISAYSFPAMAKAALPRLRPGGRLLTLSTWARCAYVPNYNTMGLAKASLEASVRFLASEPGRARHPRQRHLGRPDQDAGRVGHQGLRQAAGSSPPPRHPPHHHHRRRGQQRRLPAFRPGRRHQRRDRLRRRRLQPRRPGRPGFRTGLSPRRVSPACTTR